MQKLTQPQACRVAMMAHDGFARAINPIHTLHDGDTIFCISTGELEADVTAVGTFAGDAMTEAIIRGNKGRGVLSTAFRRLPTLQQEK